MKFEYIKSDEEKVTVYAKEKNEIVNKIEEIVLNNELNSGDLSINGYLENDIVPLKIDDIVSFYVDDDKTYAELMNKTYVIKFRLYQLEEKLGTNFIKINKSRIVNKHFIKKFDLSWNSTLLVIMKNGDSDYVSRRLMKSVKERMNI